MRKALAAFFREAALSINTAYWFCIRGECNSSFCVYTRLTIDEYAEVLFVAGLIQRGKRGFEISVELWREFLNEHGIRALEIADVSQGKVNINSLKISTAGKELEDRKTLAFLRIGEQTDETYIPTKQCKKKVPAPGFNRKLVIAQRKLYRCVECVLGTVDKQTVSDIATYIDWDDLKEFHVAANDKDKAQQYTPLKQSVHIDLFSSSSSPIATCLDIVTPSPLDKSNANKPHYHPDHPNSKFETLNKLLPFDIMDRSEGSVGVLAKARMDNILRDIVRFKQSINEEVSFESVNSHRSYALQVIPMAQDNRDFHRRTKDDRWVENLLSNVISDGNIHDGFECILDYMLRHYEVETRETLQSLGISPKIMNAHEIAATLKESKITITQWRELVKCLKSYMGLKKVCVPEIQYRMLATEVGEIKSGVLAYAKKAGERKEQLKWWTMDPASEFISQLECMVNTIPSFHPNNIKNIVSAFSGDHGQKKFRAASKLLLEMMGLENVFESIYPLADLACKKDSGEVLKSTIMPNLVPGVNKIEDSSVKFNLNESTKKWECKLVPNNTPGSIPVTAVLCGDLKFLFMILGRENFDTYWCYFCNLRKPQ